MYTSGLLVALLVMESPLLTTTETLKSLGLMRGGNILNKSVAV